MLARAAESSYNTRLRQVARQIDVVVRGLYPDGKVTDPGPITRALEAYADLLKPWAASVANYMLSDVMRRNERAWREQGKEMSRALHAEIMYAPTGHAYKELMRENVQLITSLPRKAAERVHVLALAARTGGKRYEEVAQDILATGKVTAARATLIARTESSRAAVTFTQARAQFVGSQGYIWRTAHDADVRPTHQALEGQYVRWDAPPALSSAPSIEAAAHPEEGTYKRMKPYHAGCGPNCRCFPEPILPD